MRFQAFLQAEFERRRRVNSRYSLRSFARSLAIDHSTLSQILRGTRRVTSSVVEMLGARLKIAPAEIAEYCALENDAVVLASLQRDGFQASSRWLAVRLGISIDDVNIALQRLLRTGALVMKSRGMWEAVHG